MLKAEKRRRKKNKYQMYMAENNIVSDPYLFFMDPDSANLKRILVLVQERASKGEEGNRLDSGLGEWDSESSR